MIFNQTFLIFLKLVIWQSTKRKNTASCTLMIPSRCWFLSSMQVEQLYFTKTHKMHMQLVALKLIYYSSSDLPYVPNSTRNQPFNCPVSYFCKCQYFSFLLFHILVLWEKPCFRNNLTV